MINLQCSIFHSPSPEVTINGSEIVFHRCDSLNPTFAAFRTDSVTTHCFIFKHSCLDAKKIHCITAVQFSRLLEAKAAL